MTDSVSAQIQSLCPQRATVQDDPSTPPLRHYPPCLSASTGFNPQTAAPKSNAVSLVIHLISTRIPSTNEMHILAHVRVNAVTGDVCRITLRLCSFMLSLCCCSLCTAVRGWVIFRRPCQNKGNRNSQAHTYKQPHRHTLIVCLSAHTAGRQTFVKTFSLLWICVFLVTEMFFCFDPRRHNDVALASSQPVQFLLFCLLFSSTELCDYWQVAHYS